MTTKNCANSPKLVLKDLCEKSFVRNVLYSKNHTWALLRMVSKHSFSLPKTAGSSNKNKQEMGKKHKFS